MSELSALHPSTHPFGGKRVKRPLSMSEMRLPEGSREPLTDVVLSIFADCINRAVPFQDTLLAIYLSGVENGALALREVGDE